jgi:hypothetical protein
MRLGRRSQYESKALVLSLLATKDRKCRKIFQLYLRKHGDPSTAKAAQDPIPENIIRKTVGS